MKNDNNAYKRNASIKKIKYTEIFKKHKHVHNSFIKISK